MATDPRKVLEELDELHEHMASLYWHYEEMVGYATYYADEFGDDEAYRIARKLGDIFYKQVEPLLNELWDHHVKHWIEEYKKMV